jgi:hypothetical protein
MLGILLLVHASETDLVGLPIPRLTSLPTPLDRFNVMGFGPLPRVQTWANCDYFVNVK